MDPYAQFNYLFVNASATPPAVKPVETKRERIDLIARQFRDVLYDGDPTDPTSHRFPLTPDFNLARILTPAAAWLSFQLDTGDGKTEQFQDVVQMLLLRDTSAESIQLLKKIPDMIKLPPLPEAPLAIVLQLTPKVPFIIRDWYTKPAAGFFADPR